MKPVNKYAEVDAEKCNGCKTCSSVCPTLAMKVVDRKAKVDLDRCLGCSGCEQRCPRYAIKMVPRKEVKWVGVDASKYDRDRIWEICMNAKIHPESIVCCCSGTRAKEIAAAIIAGARSPEDISLMTGARTNCKVVCIEGLLRLLVGAGITPTPPPDGGIQWVGLTPDLWSISDDVKKKYSRYYLEDDCEFLDKCLASCDKESML